MFAMLGLMGIGAVLGLVALVTSIWLLVVAFRQSVLWGLASLFIPFASVVFAIKYWGAAKKPFLASFVSGTLAGIVFFAAGGVGAHALGNQMAKPMADEAAKMQPAQTRAPSRAVPPSLPAAPPSATTAAGEPPAVPAPAPATTQGSVATILGEAASKHDPLPVVQSEPVSQDGFATVALRDAKSAVGRDAKVITRDGHTHRGELLRADGNGVAIKRYIGAGSVTMDFRTGEIEKLLVAVN